LEGESAEELVGEPTGSVSGAAVRDEVLPWSAEILGQLVDEDLQNFVMQHFLEAVWAGFVVLQAPCVQ